MVTQAREIQLREHHLKRLIKLDPFGNEGRQRPGRPEEGVGGVSVMHDEGPPHGPRRERLHTELLIASGPPISL